MDAFCYTSKEFDDLFYKGVVSILDAIDEGYCLLGSQFFMKYKALIEKLKKNGLKKDPPVWILPESMTIE